MNVMLLGPPGAGKGTQAAHIVALLGIPHISTGDAFRLAIREQSVLGVRAKQFVDQGLLVPDEITIGIVFERCEKEDCGRGFLLDGFPRTIAQAEALDAWLHMRQTQLDHVVRLHVDADVLIERITGRIVCASCGATYHRLFAPTRVAGVCDACGGVVAARVDDAQEKVVVRLQEYEEKTAPLIEYYREKHVLRTIDGMRAKEEVAAQLDALFVCSAP